MSNVLTASAKNEISATLREMGHISFEQDVVPAMRRAMSLVENNLKARIAENSKGYRLSRHTRGVHSRPWSLTTGSKTFGFTTYMNPRELLYIFNEGNYKTHPRKTKKSYKTQPYTDRLGRRVPARQYRAGISRGNIAALGYLDATRAAVERGIFSILRHDIDRAVGQRLQTM